MRPGSGRGRPRAPDGGQHQLRVRDLPYASRRHRRHPLLPLPAEISLDMPGRAVLHSPPPAALLYPNPPLPPPLAIRADERTRTRLIEPLFEDLVSLCMLPAVGGRAAPAPRAGRWRQVRAAGLEGVADGPASRVASQELKEHQMWLTFKKSSKKKYERQFVEKEFVVSDVPREETPREDAATKCTACGYFACRCAARP